MKSVIKRMTVVCMAFVMMLSMMPLLGAVYAEEPETFDVGDYTYQFSGGSV